VVGLGDGYNDIRTATGGAAPTVRTGAGTTSSVVERVAAYFGQSNVVSAATGGARIADLAAQINSIGSFSSGDLVVIAVGTFDVKENAIPATEAQTLVTQVQRLKTAGVTHILIMPVLDVSRTPWGRANSFNTTATNTFNTALLTALSTAFGGQSPNTVIFANASGVTSLFLTATSVATFSPFTDTGYNGTAAGTVPACGNPAPLLGDTSIPVGCDASAANASYTTMLFADGIHLTPAGNSWVASYLYNSTAQGWR
jgi:phospholipase/lecithinase/hemolysin